ncbi:redoxin domain-containing protein [Mucilaginibacter sp. R-33]|uniref:redoxin domain-containing protein n=1 Tax=unclassified Mucilaginibacter TaxID=2617802 RepID=UPI003CEC7335
MKNKIIYLIHVLTILSTIWSGNLFAQIPVRKGPVSAIEIEKALSVVNQNMDSINAHQDYIYKMGLNNPLLLSQYRGWISKYPQKLSIPLSLGTAYYKAEMSQAKEFLLRAAKLAPNNAQIWYMLSADAFNRGESTLQSKYLLKATSVEPSNAAYAYYYLTTFKDVDQDVYRKKAIEFINRFPTDSQGAQVLYWLGEDATDLNEKIDYFEKLRKSYPPKEYKWTTYGMTSLADAYLQTDPEKALILINTMGDNKDWQLRKQAALQLIKIKELEKQKNYKAAVIEFDELILPRFNYIDEFITLKKASLQEKAGDVKTAYDSLIEKAAKLPTDSMNNAIENFGKKLGKSDRQVNDDIKTAIAKTASLASPFKLGLYTGRDSLDLNSLKGKVVLITFWFPACGPCRAEFPYFQSVINKLNNTDIAYLGINVYPDQDPYVLPFLKNSKFSFIPLRGSADFALKNFGVKSEPTNFLIDKQGKIAFKNFTIDQKNQRSLELMIRSLL